MVVFSLITLPLAMVPLGYWMGVELALTGQPSWATLTMLGVGAVHWRVRRWRVRMRMARRMPVQWMGTLALTVVGRGWTVMNGWHPFPVALVGQQGDAHPLAHRW